jgi:hypothetical protein
VVRLSVFSHRAYGKKVEGLFRQLAFTKTLISQSFLYRAGRFCGPRIAFSAGVGALRTEG